MGKVLQFLKRQKPPAGDYVYTTITASCSSSRPPGQLAEVVPFRLTEESLKLELDRLTERFLDAEITLGELGEGIERLKKRQGVKK